MKRTVDLNYLQNFLKLDMKTIKDSLRTLVEVGAITSFYIGKTKVYIDTEYATLPIFNSKDPEPEPDGRVNTKYSESDDFDDF